MPGAAAQLILAHNIQNPLYCWRKLTRNPALERASKITQKASGSPHSTQCHYCSIRHFVLYKSLLEWADSQRSGIVNDLLSSRGLPSGTMRASKKGESLWLSYRSISLCLMPKKKKKCSLSLAEVLVGNQDHWEWLFLFRGLLGKEVAYNQSMSIHPLKAHLLQLIFIL